MSVDFSKIMPGDEITIRATVKEINNMYLCYRIGPTDWIKRENIVSHTPKLKEFKVGDTVKVGMAPATILAIDDMPKLRHMSNDYTFWREQLAGGEPETTPGTPHAGYYMVRRRTTRPNDDPGRKPGHPRNKVTTVHLPASIWFEDDRWHMLINRVEYHNDTDYIDEQFSRCCRNAIDEDEYERLTNADE